MWTVEIGDHLLTLGVVAAGVYLVVRWWGFRGRFRP